MTENTAKKPKRDAVLQTLMERFSVFQEAKPLAIGIHKAIMERSPDLTSKKVNRALHIHTGTTRYLKALSQAEHRYDLDGQEAGEVTCEQRDAAANTVRKRIKEAAEKRQAEEMARQRLEKLQKLAERFNSR